MDARRAERLDSGLVPHPNRQSDPPVAQPWSRAADEVLRELDVEVDRGLSQDEVARRRLQYGPNRLIAHAAKSAWRILRDQFASLIVLLLAVAAVVAFAFDESVEGIAILVVILINAAIGFVTESRAVRSVEALRELGQKQTNVRRENTVRPVPADELVPGDIVILDAGDVLTADLRTIVASRLQADESALTGESVPVSKSADPVDADASTAERESMLFKGTALTGGTGEAVVVATGMATELGVISSLVVEAEAEITPLEKRLDKLGRRLIGLTLVIAAIVAVTVLSAGRGAFMAVEIAIALAVATIPEGLPIVATVALARGMSRMASRNALVEELAAVETLGSTTALLTDKTGTLTENRMTAVEYELADGRVEVEGIGLVTEGRFSRDDAELDPTSSKVLVETLRAGVLCNNATLDHDQDGTAHSTGDPTEVALLVAGVKAGLEPSVLRAELPELQEVAFDSTTKRMATLHELQGERFAAVKGAPETILECCTEVRTEDGSRPLDDADRSSWLERAESCAARGERVLALATKAVSQSDSFEYEGLCLLGLVGLLDPPRESARSAIDACQEAGIRVVMVTGDHGATGFAVASAVGLVEADAPPSFLDARHLRPIDELDAEGKRELLEASVIARADPRQKLDLIELHQRAGAVVAMTGDGVNDAPALKKADIGVAMGMRGTQVAREAADMVLRDDELSTIVAAVAEGRAIFANIRRFVIYLMSCNVSEIFVVALGAAIPGPLPILPLQILFLNMVTDVFPALALGVCEGSPSLMQRAPRDPSEQILARRHWRRIFGLGGVMAASVIAALLVAQHGLAATDRQVTTVTFLTLALAQLWHALSMRSSRSHWARNEVTRNPWLWSAIALCIALLVAGVHWTPFAAVLAVENPGVAGWAVALGFSVIPLIVGQVALLLRVKYRAAFVSSI
jgi:P-type Ca2+ transporter type 2C